MKPTEDLSSTGPTVTDRHARALTAVSAYGASVALNKTRQRPVSAKVASSQGEAVKAIFASLNVEYTNKIGVGLEHRGGCCEFKLSPRALCISLLGRH